MVVLEPTTYGLLARRSTIELHDIWKYSGHLEFPLTFFI